MKFEMTERDKRLLIFLAIFVIVVCIGYWGILPVIKDMNQLKYDTLEEQQIKQTNDMKVAQLPILEKENEEYEKDIISAKSDFYGMMDADEIDRLFTTMALDYNLYAYAMDITMPKMDEQADLEAYQFSEKYQLDQMAGEEMFMEEGGSAAEVAASGNEKTESMIHDVDVAAGNEIDDAEYFEDEMVGIYMAEIRMRLGGDEALLQKLIDDLSDSEKKLRLVAYAWEDDTNIDITDAGLYHISYDKLLNITVEIYMCEE